MYAQMIREALAAIGEAGAADPRHIEGYMRLGAGTLDALTPAQFRREVALSLACIRAEGIETAEQNARSFGLLPAGEAPGEIRTYRILRVRFEPDHVETHHYFEATAIGEALLMAEREDAGKAGYAYTYGIASDDYAEARGAGIAFNEADGLLLDGDHCSECGDDLTFTDIEAGDRLCSDCTRRRDAAERSRGAR